MSQEIFVYGSLMKDFFNYKKYLEGHVTSIEKGYVKGTLYDMPYKGYPALLEGDDTICGEIITVSDYEAIIDSIDAMEGFNGKDDDEYKRVSMDVTREDGTHTELGVYFYHSHSRDENFTQAIYLPEGSWRAYKELKGED